MTFLAAVRFGCAFVLAGVAAGCNFTGGTGMNRPTATVIRQAEPNPLRNVQSFQLTAVTFDGFTVDGVPEAAWLAGRSQDQRGSWDNDKRMLTDRLFDRLENEASEGVTIARASASSPPGSFVLVINVDKFEQSTFHGTLRIVDAGGQVIDEVRLPVRYGGQFIFGMDSIALSLNTFVTWAAADTMEYVYSRTRPSGAPAEGHAERPASPAPSAGQAQRPAPSLAGAPGSTASCKTHLDCKGGLVCPQGQCVQPSCIADKECGAGKFCTLEGICETLGAK